MKVAIIKIVIGAFSTVTKGQEDLVVRGLGDGKTSENHLNYYIIENSQNTEKSPGELRRLAVTQTPVKNHQLKLSMSK